MQDELEGFGLKGAYVLVLTLSDRGEVCTKKRCWILESGTYVYVGSGMVNLEKRVLRHFRSKKKLHWHIDYLSQYAKPLFAFLIPSDKSLEEEISHAFAKYFRCVDGFGASDLGVSSNLYLIDDFSKFSDILAGF